MSGHERAPGYEHDKDTRQHGTEKVPVKQRLTRAELQREIGKSALREERKARVAPEAGRLALDRAAREDERPRGER